MIHRFSTILSPLRILFSRSASSALSPASVKHDPNLVIAFFGSHGFSQPQISRLVTFHPRFLLSDPTKTLKPKLDFYLAAGFSSADIAKLVTSDPHLLLGSLRNRIAPSFAFLRSILPSNEDVLAAVKRTSWLLRVDLEKKLAPNIAALRRIGVPDSRISKLVRIHSSALMQSSDRFSRGLERLRRMGFMPSRMNFIYALDAVSGKSEESWERKLAVYRSFGLSEEAILAGIRRQPLLMNLSEENIRKTMGFFVEKLKWKPEAVFAHPEIMGFSLEKRIAPRVEVVEALGVKGLVPQDPIEYGLFRLSEKDFAVRYVQKFCKVCPELLETCQASKAK